MFDPGALRRAVDIQKRSYRLLKWAVNGVGRGFLQFDHVEKFATFDDAAHAWLARHYDAVPAEARPARDDLGDFARFFTSYVDSSFDLVEHSGQRLYSEGAHCFCPLCSWLVDVPRLQPKKLTRADKTRARRLMVGALDAICAEQGISLSETERETVANDGSMREPLALVAYGIDLISRLRGAVQGPATLALWRTFAWLPEGSPKKGFEMSADAILEAERQLVTRLGRAR